MVAHFLEHQYDGNPDCAVAAARVAQDFHGHVGLGRLSGAIMVSDTTVDMTGLSGSKHKRQNMF